MRTIDDKIIYALNTSIPTDSFRSQVDASSTCKNLYENLKSGHEERANAIKKCITVSANKVQNFKQQRENNNNDLSLLKKLRAEQTKVCPAIVRNMMHKYFHVIFFAVSTIASRT